METDDEFQARMDRARKKESTSAIIASVVGLSLYGASVWFWLFSDGLDVPWILIFLTSAIFLLLLAINRGLLGIYRARKPDIIDFGTDDIPTINTGQING